MKYPKIQSLWKREEGSTNKGKILEGQYSLDEIPNIKQWEVQEKIDGTNIRIRFYHKLEGDINHYYSETPSIEIMGRGDDASIPNHLCKYLISHFNHERLSKVFCTNEEVLLFGEGYGPKIQSGGNYRKDAGFILFDIKIGFWLLKQSDVKNIAESLEVPYAPIIGLMTEQEIVDYVKSKPLSLCSITPQVMEGIIARPPDLLFLRNGDRLMFKLKCKDFDR